MTTPDPDTEAGLEAGGLGLLEPRATPPGGAPAPQDELPRQLRPGLSRGDRVFRRTATGAGAVTLLFLALIGAFLLIRALPAFRSQGLHFFTGTKFQTSGSRPDFGIAAVIYWTVVIAVIALVVAVPVSLLSAVFLTEYVPRRLRRPLTALVDLLAAVPSIIFGLWGLLVLQDHVTPTVDWLAHHLSFLPFFHARNQQYAGSALMAGLVVSLMVLPITTSIMREVFSQAPLGEREAALALGSTRWGMVRTVVLPFGRGGIVGATMLGLGRALGETIAVAVIISPLFAVRADVLTSGANSVASLIALQFGEANTLGISALMAAGLTLFALTLLVNTAASFVVARSRSGAGVDA